MPETGREGRDRVGQIDHGKGLGSLGKVLSHWRSLHRRTTDVSCAFDPLSPVHLQ